MVKNLLNLYRKLPLFKGKLRLGKLIFKNFIGKNDPLLFIAKDNIQYQIPNTLENIGVELLINGVYENDVVCFLKKQIKTSDIFFDIGANIGSIGLPIIKKNPSVQYFAFEASPMVFQYLENNCKINNISNYQLFNKLVHKNSGVSMQFFQSDLYGKSSLAPTYSKESITIDAISIDQICSEKKIPKVDWMKVDVQGFELFVFEGMSETLAAKKVKNILFEFEEWAEDQAGIPRRAAIDFIKKFEYDLYSMDGNRWEKANEKETMIWAKAKSV